MTGGKSWSETGWRVAAGVLWGGVIFLFFLVAFEHLLAIPVWLKVAGRMHPMFLHFPIVMLGMSFLSIWIPSRDKKLDNWLHLFRLTAALSAVITAIMGLLLSMEEDRSGGALQWHKWSGTGLALLGFIFYSWYPFFRRHRKTGRALTLAACGVIVVTGHFGATLTHGENYLLAPLSVERKVPLAQAVIYADVIRPVLQAKCIGCHGSGSFKGGLQLDDIAGMLAGGKTGPLFVPGDPAVSLLMKRIHLPTGDKKHMPPASKSQLTEDEVALLQAWIRAGAVMDKKLTTLPVQDTFRMLASAALGSEAVPNQPVYTFASAPPEKIAALNNNFRVLEQPGEGSPAINVQFYGREQYSAKALEELLVIKQQITELNLSRMPVTDKDLGVVKEMPNLTKLNLNYSTITANGLAQLLSLKNLQQLSLSGTSVNAAAIEKLMILPQLKNIFLWNTAIDSAEVKKWQARFPGIRLETGFVDNGEQKMALSQPVIKPQGTVITEPITVSMKHPFHGVNIRYTTDGTMPDSVNSKLYTGPFQIDSTTILVARAFKDGWYGSNEGRATYLKRGFLPDSVDMLTPPDPKYKSVDKKILSDAVLGDMNIANGDWLGYQVNDAGYCLYFNKAVTIDQLTLNLLKNTGSSIFPPTSTAIWGGPDKDHLSLLAQLTPPAITRNEPAAVFTQVLNFRPVQVKVVKVVASHLKTIPAWHKNKGKDGWVLISEIVVN